VQAQRRSNEQPEALEQALLDLTDPLARQGEARGDLLARARLLGDEALAEDRGVTLAQRLAELGQLLLQDAVQLDRLEGVVGARVTRVGHAIEQGRRRVVTAQRIIERDVDRRRLPVEEAAPLGPATTGAH